MKAVVWEGGPLDQQTKLAILRSGDLAYFRSLCAEGELRKPERVFVLSPNGDKYSREILAFLELCHSEEVAASGTGANDIQPLVLWGLIVEAVSRWDAKALRSISASLSNISPGIFGELPRLARFLGLFVDAVIEPVAELAIHQLSTKESAYEAWWDMPIAALSRINRFIEDRTAILSPQTEVERLAIEAAAANVNRLMKLSSGSLDSRLYHYSLFLAGYSEVCYQRGNWTLCALLTHRAFEQYLNHLAVKTGKIHKTPSGLIYGDTKESVYLKATEALLFREGVLGSSSTRASFITWLNAVRNSSVLTHGAGYVTSSSARSALDDVKTHIERIEGNKRWTMGVDEQFVTPRWVLCDIFSAVQDIETYFTEEAIK